MIEKVERRAGLLGAGGQHGPDALAPAAAGLAASPLGDIAVDHHEAESLLHRIVGRLDAGRVQEAKVMFGVSTKPLGDVPGLAAAGRTPCYVQHVTLCPLGSVCFH